MVLEPIVGHNYYCLWSLVMALLYPRYRGQAAYYKYGRVSTVVKRGNYNPPTCTAVHAFLETNYQGVIVGGVASFSRFFFVRVVRVLYCFGCASKKCGIGHVAPSYTKKDGQVWVCMVSSLSVSGKMLCLVLRLF